MEFTPLEDIHVKHWPGLPVFHPVASASYHAPLGGTFKSGKYVLWTEDPKLIDTPLPGTIETTLLPDEVEILAGEYTSGYAFDVGVIVRFDVAFYGRATVNGYDVTFMTSFGSTLCYPSYYLWVPKVLADTLVGL
jgi:hypothetical protein